jgi:hypothetical protein
VKVLCYGSFLTVLVYNQAHSSTQKKLCGTMLLSLDPNDDRRDDDGFASALARGKSNLPDAALDAVPDADPKKITEYFKTSVFFDTAHSVCPSISPFSPLWNNKYLPVTMSFIVSSSSL